MRHVLATAVIAATAALSACGSTDAPAQTVPVETPNPQAPSTPPAADKQLVGRAQTSADDDSTVEVTVLRLRQPFKPPVAGVLDRKGYEYAAVEAKVCVTRNDGELPIAVSWGPWSLSWESGIVAESASSYSSEWWDEPLYPQDHIVRPGRCARGWIPFEVRRSDGRPALVSYTPSAGPALEWRVAA
jgi:hypothetical protein